MASSSLKMMGVIEVPTDDMMNHKQSTKYAGNHHTGHSNEKDDFGQTQMPNRKGNMGKMSGKQAGPATAGANANPVQSGKRKWMPSATENFVGDFNKMNAGPSRNKTGNLK